MIHPTVPSCDEAPGRLVMDPTSATQAGPMVWQQWSDVRLHYLVENRLLSSDPPPFEVYITRTGVDTPTFFSFSTDHPAGFATIRPMEPGTYMVMIAGQTICGEVFHVVPEVFGELEAGTLDIDLEQSGTGAHVTLRSLDPSGDALPHYEFDVHVIRTADDAPALLAWRGKLHGHGGEVSFTVEGLAPGDYKIRVHPSPQDPGIPPLAGGSDGFMRGFTVEGTWNDDEDDGPDITVTPVPSILLLVVLALLLTARGRSGKSARL